eukprot:scaffold49012_cov37-Tisochrysis_lutea.AAC.1
MAQAPRDLWRAISTPPSGRALDERYQCDQHHGTSGGDERGRLRRLRGAAEGGIVLYGKQKLYSYAGTFSVYVETF